MNVLVIGDYCQDVFVRGRADRLCPEAPCPVLNPVKWEHNNGMAGNVFDNVRSLREGVNAFTIFQSQPITKTRYVDLTSGYILLRVDENDSVKQSLTIDELKSEVESSNLKFDIALFSDYNKGFLTKEVMQEAFAYFNDNGVTTFLDTKKILGDWSKLVDFVKINEKEYNEQLKAGGGVEDHPIRFCRHLIVTLGQAGSVYMNTRQHVPTKKVEVMDVSGAGDTYFAAFAIKYHETKNVLESMDYANRAASVAVSKHGVVAVKQSEVV